MTNLLPIILYSEMLKDFILQVLQSGMRSIFHEIQIPACHMDQ